jgi:hypothetical protein
MPPGFHSELNRRVSLATGRDLDGRPMVFSLPLSAAQVVRLVGDSLREAVEPGEGGGS